MIVKSSKAAVVLLIVLFFVTACSNGGQGSDNGSERTAKLRVMFPKSEGKDTFYDWMQENIKLFKETHPNVEFEVTANTAGDQYLTVLTSEMAANNVPDIVQGWTFDRMAPFVEAGRFLDLTEALKDDPEWRDMLMDGPLQSTTFDGGIYGLPTTLDSEVVFYNKEVFSKYNLEVPKTYDDFLHIVDVLKSNDITPMTIPNKEPWVGSIPFMMIAERVGGAELFLNVLSADAPWNNEPFVESAKKLQELIALGAFEKDVNSVTFTEADAKLAEGKAAMYAYGTWGMPVMLDKLGDNLGYFNFPDITGGKGSKDDYIILPNKPLSVSNTTKYKEEAIEFLKFTFTQERQQALVKAGFIPATKVELAEGDMSPIAKSILEDISNAEASVYPLDLPLAIGQEFNKTTQAFYLGNDPQEMLDQLQQKQLSQKK